MLLKYLVDKEQRLVQSEAERNNAENVLYRSLKTTCVRKERCKKLEQMRRIKSEQFESQWEIQQRSWKGVNWLMKEKVKKKVIRWAQRSNLVTT